MFAVPTPGGICPSAYGGRGDCRTLLVLCASPALGAAPDEVTQRGFRHTTRDRDLVVKATARANDILAAKGIRFVPTWQMEANEAGRVNGADGASVVPLYLVESPREATTPAAVPQGCYCVFVNPKFLSTWTAFNSKGVGRLTIDRDYFLTFVLLHEARHIQAGTSAAAFQNGEISQLNVDPSKEKADERRADEFAAELLRQRAYATPATSSSIAANFVVNELVKLGWNMQAFGPSTSSHPSPPESQASTSMTAIRTRTWRCASFAPTT